MCNSEITAHKYFSLNINFAFKYNLHFFSTAGFDERASPKFMPDENEERWQNGKIHAWGLEVYKK